jgi:SAM-dependent methyltransferase
MTITTPDPTAPAPPADDVETFADKVFADLLGAMSTYAVTIGVTLGWYEALARSGSMSSDELAAATGTDERYAREWLEQQTISGYLHIAGRNTDPTSRRYAISAAGAEVLANRDSLAYMAPFAGLLSALGSSLDGIIDVYRTGDGFGWHEHGDKARCGQAEANRPMFLNLLAKEYLASIGDVHATLSGTARVADVGCGLGWSSIGVAQAYPGVTVDGYDIDEPSIERAKVYAAEAGVADRVRFHTADVGTLAAGGYDLALALECIHDLADPVSVLAAMRSMVKPDGVVIVMDERVGETFTGDADSVEQLMYGFSLLCCLPDGRNAAQSVATGTVMRQPTFEGYAHQAGFSSVEVLPIENDFFRFYRLTP